MTTVSLDGETRDRLDDHKHPDDERLTDTIARLLEIMPDYEDQLDGCMICGEFDASNPLDETGGVVEFFRSPESYGGNLHATLFCSSDCYKEHMRSVDNQVPDEVDRVVVGGGEKPLVDVEYPARYYMDGKAVEVLFDVPSAFDGYEDEPIFVKNSGSWIMSGHVDRVYHDSSTTTLGIRQTPPDEEYHPEN